MPLVFHVDLRTTQLAAIKSIWSPKCITTPWKKSNPKPIYCMILFICYSEKGKVIGIKKESAVVQGLEMVGEWLQSSLRELWKIWKLLASWLQWCLHNCPFIKTQNSNSHLKHSYWDFPVAVKWLRTYVSKGRGTGSIPGQKKLTHVCRQKFFK